VAANETPVELVDHVIRAILPGVRSVRLGGTDLGEQLTSRNFNRFLQAVIDTPPKHLEIVSNLTVLDAVRADLIARACDDFGVSLEGVGAAFERVRHFPWSRIESHLKMLEEARARLPESRLKVFCLVTCFYDNLRDLEAILDLDALGVRRFDFRLYRATVPAQSAQMLEHHQGEANEVFARIREVAARRGLQVYTPQPFEIGPLVPLAAPAPAPAASPGGKRVWTCHFPFETVSLYSDGRVSPCCEDLYLGQVDRAAPDLLAVFRSGAWRELRESLAAGRPTGRCVDCELRRSRQAELDQAGT
jgi:MoaA/NifB/PqqE/SkfB family radical SAM enzyme